MIKLQNINKTYGLKKALVDVNIEFKKGFVYALVGQSGSGKTTIIKLLLKLTKPDSGKVTIDGVKSPSKVFDNITYLKDTFSFSNSIVIKDLVEITSKLQKDFNKNTCNEILKKLEIDTSKTFGSFSKGQKMFVRIALTISRKAKAYVLDEPLSGIDVLSRKKILDVILTTIDTENSLVIMSSHELNDIENSVDKVVLIKNKTIEGCYDVDELKSENNESLQDWFIEKNTQKKL